MNDTSILAGSSAEKTHILIQHLKGLENSNLTAMAMLTILLWDWLLSLDREIKHFWRARWTLGTYLYFANRFIPTLFSILHISTTVVSWSPEVQQRMCKPTLVTLVVLSALSFSIVQCIMALRTYALYGNNKLLLVILMSFSVANLVNQIYWVPPIRGHDLVNTFPAPYNGCLVVGGVLGPTWVKYVPLMAFEALLLALTVHKFVQFVKSGSKAMVPQVLFRDGFIGFIAAIFSTVFGTLVLIFKPDSLLSVGQILAPVVPVLVASRMLLNLRDIMKMSTLVVGSPRIMSTGSYSRATLRPPVVPGSKGAKPGTRAGMGSNPLQDLDFGKQSIEGHSATNVIILKIKDTESGSGASAKARMAGNEDAASMSAPSAVDSGLYDEFYAGITPDDGPRHFDSRTLEDGGDAHAHYARDASDDDSDEDASFDERRHHGRHARPPVSVRARWVSEDIELGEQLPTSARDNQYPAVQHSSTNLAPPSRSRANIFREARVGGRDRDSHPHATRRVLGRPAQRGDQESDAGSSVLIIQ